MNARGQPVDAAQRVEALDWAQVECELDAQGNALIPNLLSRGECESLVAMYSEESLFRKRVVMATHGFGRGEYKYFGYPLPALVLDFREALYPRLAAIANRWNQAMGTVVRYPQSLEEFIERCHAAGQLRPTPLLLKYGPGDYNCLHQDLYGEHVFPLQLIVLLSAPGQEFTGGELVVTEQRPRMQTRAMVLPLRQGDAALIAVRQRPVQGTRGVFRVNLRHGVSQVLSGQRHTAGIIFHDAS